MSLHSGTLAPELASARVLLLAIKDFSLRHKLSPSKSDISEKFAALGKSLVMRMSAVNKESPSLTFLERATEFINSTQLSSAIAFYALRPNLMYQQKIESHMTRIFPDDFAPEHSMGLPIRGM
jgi:hypothetical protein